MKGNVGARYTSLLLALFLVAGLAGGLQWSNHPMTASANGDTTLTTIAIEPSSQQAALGSHVTVNISVDSTAEPLASLQLDLTFDTSVLNVTDVTDGGMFDNWGPSSPTINNTAGVVKGIAAYNDFGSGNTSTQGTLATVTFEVIDEGSATIGMTDVMAYNATYDEIDQAAIDAVGGTVATATMLNLEPASQTTSAGETVTLNVSMIPAEPVQSLSFNVTFDQAILHADTVVNSSLLSLFGNYTINNTTGYISNVTLVRLSSEPIAEPTVVATINFTAADSGVAAVGLHDPVVKDSGGTSLDVNTTGATVTVDGTPPEITDNTPDTATTGDDFTFNATVEDNMAGFAETGEVWIEYWYGDGDHVNESMTLGTGSDYTKTITVENTTENLSYVIAARDTSGNWNQTDTKNVTIIDDDSPGVTGTIGDVTIGTGNATTLWATAKDNINVTSATIKIDETTDDMTWNAGQSRWEYDYTAPTDETGDYTYTVTVSDAAGNQGSSPPYTITVQDDEPPSIETVTGDTTGTTGDTTTITATFSDNIGVTTATFHYRTSAGSWNTKSILNGSADIDVPSDSTDTWDYYVTVNDAADNGPVRAPSTEYYTITVTDDDAPSVNINSGPSGTIDTASGTFTWSGSDNIGGLRYRYKLTGGWTSWSTATSYTFNNLADGSYTFSVQAKDGADLTSGTRTRSFTVDTNTPPTASFTVSPSSPTDLDTITFTSTSTDEDGDIANYSWALGDGTTAYGETASHSYQDNGSYMVTLTVTDDKGDTDTETKQVLVANEPPTATIQSDPATTAQIDQDVQFNSTLSSDQDGEIVNYSWTFGDGNTSTQANPTHAYEKAGTYTVNLTVTDNDGDTDTTTITLTVEKEQPDYLLPVIAIIVLIVIAIVVVLVWRRRSMGGE